MKSLLVICLGFIPLAIYSQQECSEIGQPPFQPGERLAYELSYNWGFIWADAGAVVFTVSDTIVHGELLYNFKATGTSYRSWDWFYKVRTTYESWSTKALKPKEFHRKGKEGSHFYDREYVIGESFADYTAVNEDGEVSKKRITLPKCPLDVISAIYYCRSIEFDEYQEGDQIPLNLLLDGSHFSSHLTYIGKQKWTDPNTDIEYDCIVFKPFLIEGTIFDAGEKMTVYVTDDQYKIPIYIETELVVGKGKVFLTGKSGLK